MLRSCFAMLWIGIGFFPALAQAKNGDPCQLPLPSTMSADAYENLLFQYLKNGCYKDWVKDQDIRDTGPYILGDNYGTHGAVHIYYSDDVYTWLKGGRTVDDAIGNGSMIVKEQYPLPAANLDKDPQLQSWAVMVKDRNGSFDGWYWSYIPIKGPSNDNPIDYPESGFGLYCLNCHASAEKEATFSSLNNINGDQMHYALVDPPQAQTITQGSMDGERDGAPPVVHSKKNALPVGDALRKANPKPAQVFLDSFPDLPELDLDKVKRLPGEGLDHVVAGPHGSEQFLTSDNCIGCHDATQNNSAPPNMIWPPDGDADEIVNLSMYAEWHAGMMGWSGRDPVFFAQLESEGQLHPEHKDYIQNLCFRCHGAMGQRQLHIDQGEDVDFSLDMIYATGDDPNAKYGALARDGVSCTVCHHVAAEGLGTPSTFTGQFNVGPADELYGPYENVMTKPMQNSLDVTPKFGSQIKESALCGSCHTVYLPVFGDCEVDTGHEEKNQKMVYEQTTYLEWLNSSYQNETSPINDAKAQTCQNCHMKQHYQPEGSEDTEKLIYRIANIQDDTFAFAENILPRDELNVVPRDSYSRHTLSGINLFSLMFFQQFPDILGVRSVDPMSTFGNPVEPMKTVERAVLKQAREETVTVKIAALKSDNTHLTATVDITNLVGHHFPSGVGFRRGFLEFRVEDANGKTLWISGGTNSAGIILNGADGTMLPSEFFIEENGAPSYQPHYEEITAQNQVQIYEELIKNPNGQFTTSFVSLCEKVKDNRLQPLGWKVNGPYWQETKPNGNAASDCNYVTNPDCGTYGEPSPAMDSITYKVAISDLKGTPAKVRATMYYQALPPYYLYQRFTQGHGPETQRLAAFVTHLKVEGTPIEDWKLQLVSASASVR